MAEQTSNEVQRPETQHERWIKYGGNVVLVSVVVVVLAIVLVWLAQEVNARVDTTTAGLYSLKPQTVKIIQENQNPIKIVSLYTRVKRQSTREIAGQEDTFDYITPIADLLEEYKRKGKNIDVEAIDPNEQPTKVDQLIRDVTEKYGGEVQKYKELIKEYPATYGKINDIIKQELAKIESLGSMQKARGAQAAADARDKEWLEGLSQTVTSVSQIAQKIAENQQDLERILKQKIPDYRGAVDSIEGGMSFLSQLAGALVEAFKQAKDVQNYPQDARQYMEQAIPRFEQIKAEAEALLKRIKELGELKLDTLKQSLDQQDTILVMGPNDVRVLPREKIWQMVDREQLLTPDQRPRPRFAAEQQITSAILAVTAKSKPKVVFVRPGGPPLTSGNPFMGIGQFYIIAERLRDYNFEVLEKDLSGMWAMQSQMRGMPGAPEPSDEEIKDAVWIVVGMNVGGGPMQQPPAPMSPKLQEHLNRGGSALVLGDLRGDNMAQALDEWGVKIRTDAMAVHEPVEGVQTTGDIVEDAQRVPYIFIITEYGNHLIARTLRSLEGLILPIIPVSVEQKQGFKAEKLIPVPQTLKTWGETSVESLEEGVKYDSALDIAPPLYGGAVVEKEGGGGRLVVIGSVAFASNRIAGLADNRMRSAVLRFPGNQELFMNSIFWLARMEPMIAISPTAMEVNRIQPMNPGLHNFWRVGVVLVMLPLAVVFAGAAMYMKRRD